MKRKFKSLPILLLIIIGLFTSGCSNQPEIFTDNNIPEEILSDSSISDNASVDLDRYFPMSDEIGKPGIESLYYKFDHMISRMETDVVGNLYVLSMNESINNMLWTITKDDETKQKLDDIISDIYFDEENKIFYVYNSSQKTIEERNQSFNLIRVLVNDFYPFEVSEMFVKNKHLYVLCVSDNPYEGDEDAVHIDPEDDYRDYGEKLYSISLIDCKKTEVETDGLISMCDSESQYFYLYVYRNHTYYIDVFDSEKNMVVYSLETNDMGYVFSFAVIGKKVYYYSNGATGLCSKDLTNGMVAIEVSGYFSLMQSDFDVHGQYLVFLNRNTSEISVLDTETGDISSGKGTVRKTNEKSDLIIGCMSLPFDIEELSAVTGMAIGSYEAPMVDEDDFNEQLFMKLMAKDSDIDVYIFYNNDPALKKISMDGVCFPLDTSQILLDENNKYFDNIANHFKTSNGHIWGIPLASSIPVIVAYPDNMKEKNIPKDVFSDFSTMLEALKNMDDRSGVFIAAQQYGYFLLADYVTNNLNRTDFTEDSFKRYFVDMWGGWNMSDNRGYSNHPYMGVAEEYATINGERVRLTVNQNALMVNPETTLFHIVGSGDIMKNDIMRDSTEIYPIPLISEDEKQGMPIGSIAVINPYGDNKENAIKFLEKYAVYLRKTGSLGFILKDKNDYPDSFDVYSKAFESLYEIGEKSVVLDYGITADIFYNEITDYQYGKIDLENAIKSMQRKEDAYRNE